MRGLETLQLSELEQRFCHAARDGKDCDLRTDDTDAEGWGSEREIRAEVVWSVLTRRDGGERPAETAVTLKGAVIVGELTDMDGIELPPLRFECCRFDAKVSFDRAIFTGEARFDGSQFTRHARFSEAIFRSDARFEHVTFRYAEFYKVTVGGDAVFYGAQFLGEPSNAGPCAHFRRARFQGDVHLRRAHFHTDASFVRTRFEGDAHFGALGEESSWEEHPERALAATFSGKATFHHACFDGYSGFKNAVFDGDVNFYETTFAGDADFYRARFGGPSCNLRFERSRFRGNAEFRGARFEGPASFQNAMFDSDAHFGSTDHAPGAHFGGDADFAEATVASCAEFSSVTFGGSARFDWAKCGRVTFQDAIFEAGSHFSGEALQADWLNLRVADPPTHLSLKDARIHTLEDSWDAWPDDRCLTGCAYQRIQAQSYLDRTEMRTRRAWPPHRWFLLQYRQDLDSIESSGADQMGVASRIDWLMGEKGYDPFRYDQIIAAYRQAGDENSANTVALAKQRERRGTLRRPGQAWGVLQDYLVGYGYRLWLPVVWIAVSIVIGAVIFDVGPHPASRTPLPSFESIYYTTDLIFPVVNLGHRANFEFHDWRVWLAYGYMLAGWLLAASVIAGVQRVLSQKN